MMKIDLRAKLARTTKMMRARKMKRQHINRVTRRVFER